MVIGARRNKPILPAIGAAVLALFSTTLTYIAPEPVYAAAIVEATSSPEVEIATSSIKDLVYAKARHYGVSGHQMWITISTCENIALDPKLQSRIINPTGPNGREDSWGLAMINLPWHPEITREQAQDAEFSIDFMAREFAAGHASRWTCWRIIFGAALSPTASTTPL